LDGLTEGASRQTGIPKEHISASIGGEFIGAVLETVSGLFSKGWLHPAVNALAGAIALGYSVYGKDVPERLRRELMSLGSHLAFRALELVKFVEFKASLEAFTRYLKAGDINAALSTILKTPGEVATALGIPVGPAPAQVRVASPVISPRASPPRPATQTTQQAQAGRGARVF